MCKLAIIPFVKPGKEANAFKLAAALAPLLTANDSDGFGYMALGNDGVYGERWLSVDDAFKTRDKSSVAPVIEASYLGALVATSGTGYNSFGVKSDRTYAIALHARMATCGVSLDNVHPFVSKDGKSALVHNGVIANHKAWDKTLSSCDSEAILSSYCESNVANDAANIQRVAESLQGWYACAMFAKDNHGTWWLDIFKDDRTPLTAMYVPAIDGLVFVTRIEMLQAALKSLGWKQGALFDVAESILIRHLAITGEVVQVVDIDDLSDIPAARFDAGYPASDYTATVDDDGALDAYDYITTPSYWSNRRAK